MVVINHAEMIHCGLKWKGRDRLNVDIYCISAVVALGLSDTKAYIH